MGAISVMRGQLLVSFPLACVGLLIFFCIFPIYLIIFNLIYFYVLNTTVFWCGNFIKTWITYTLAVIAYLQSVYKAKINTQIFAIVCKIYTYSYFFIMIMKLSFHSNTQLSCFSLLYIVLYSFRSLSKLQQVVWTYNNVYRKFVLDHFI